MDILGVFVLVIEFFNDEFMMKFLVGWNGSFISNVMWCNIFG